MEDLGPGEIRTIQVKPPIVVRDFALELGMKPFKLISELMEMGIFGSINQSLEEDVASEVANAHPEMLAAWRHRPTHDLPAGPGAESLAQVGAGAAPGGSAAGSRRSQAAAQSEPRSARRSRRSR